MSDAGTMAKALALDALIKALEEKLIAGDEATLDRTVGPGRYESAKDVAADRKRIAAVNRANYRAQLKAVPHDQHTEG